MTAIEVNFLTGRYVASSHHARDQGEWPPHPARLFSALVATWADADSPDEAERAALEWLESQPPPSIAASEAVHRHVVSYFVPVNDARVVSPAAYNKRASAIDGLLTEFDKLIKGRGGELTKKTEVLLRQIDKKRDVSSMTASAGNTNPKSALALLPEGRVKKERFFPSVTPLDSRVVFDWPGSAPPDVAQALHGLVGRVTRIGHSASLVSCQLRKKSPPATYLPSRTATAQGTTVLRWVQEGQLRALEELHRQHQAVRPRDLPFRGVYYKTAEGGQADKARSTSKPDTAGDWVVFELEPAHRRLPLTRTVGLTEALRGAVFRHASDPLPEGLSGHRADGMPTTEPHVAFLALPNVGYKHSDGRVMGLAVSLPENLDETARTVTLRAIGEWERDEESNGSGSLRLQLGRGGMLRMRRRMGPWALVSLRPRSWSRRSNQWVSATPVALPTHPGRLSSGTAPARAKAWAKAEAAVVRALEHIGLPEPSAVTVSLTPFLPGSRPVAAFPTFKQGGGRHGGTARCLVHAAIRFTHPVAGPFMLGSGRYSGLGLMRPVLTATNDDEEIARSGKASNNE